MKVVIVGATGSLGRALAVNEAKRNSDLVLVSSDIRDLTPMMSDLKLRYSVDVQVVAVDVRTTISKSAIPLDADRYYFPIGATIEEDTFGIESDAIEAVFRINLLCITEILSFVLSEPRVSTIDIIAFGSIAQTRGRSSNIFYSASKRALTSVFESLLHFSHESKCRPFLFQLGYMKSQLSFGKKMLFPAAEPHAVAERVLAIIEKKKPSIYFVPYFWRWVCFILLKVPWPIYRKLKF